MKHAKSMAYQQITSLLTLGLILAGLSLLLILTSCGAAASPASADAGSSASATEALKKHAAGEMGGFDDITVNPEYLAVDWNAYDVSNATP